MNTFLPPLRRVWPAFALALGLIGAPATAQDWYAGAGLGGAGAQSDFSGGLAASAEYDPGAALVAFVGRRIAPEIRIEAQLFHASLDVANIDSSFANPDGGALHSGGLFVNLIRDLPTGQRLTPYLGAGLGAVNLRYDLVRDLGGGTLHRDDLRAAGQVILGATLDLSGDWDAFGDLRAIWSESLSATTSTGDSVTVGTRSQILSFGLVRRF